MSKTAEELAEYNAGYKQGEIVGTNYLQMIRAENYKNDVVLAKEIAATYIKLFEQEIISQVYLDGFEDGLYSITKLLETATDKLKN